MKARRDLERGAVEVARRLLGAVVTSDLDGERVRVRIVETEAYRQDDPASHTFRGPTPGNRVMFGPPGYAYVYFTYGMHDCMNVVCEPDEVGAAVLLRAGEVVEGIEVATSRRGGVLPLASGPARLTQALGVRRVHDGIDLLDPASPVRLALGDPVPDGAIATGPRVGIRAAADKPWRFWIEGDPAVSRYVRHPKALRTPGSR
jgi:DNA-3-methyladenine glycosylase